MLRGKTAGLRDLRVPRQLLLRAPSERPPRVAEFFSGIGLMRLGLERAGFEVVWANDLDEHKGHMYRREFGDGDLVVGDIRLVSGETLPVVELATASFPCTDLSLAGNRAGLKGSESGVLWEFARILKEAGSRRPRLVMLENVIGFATSHGGQDLVDAVARLNGLGYSCDIIVVDARHFVPQSRPRMFIVGDASAAAGGDWRPSDVRPAWVGEFVKAHPHLRMHARELRSLPPSVERIADVVERMTPDDKRWWPEERVASFVDSLAEPHRQRLHQLRAGRRRQWRTAYRRTRNGVAVWEIRGDELAGCLRTARGGSSRQAVVEAGSGTVRVRWMTPREYARLQGAGEYALNDSGESKAVFGFGDAVCVPVIEWIAREYLRAALGLPQEAPQAATG